METLRADAWHDHGAVTIPHDDPRLKPWEAACLEGIGLRFWGPRRTPCAAKG